MDVEVRRRQQSASPARERIGQILSGTGGPLIGLLLLGLALFIATPYFLTANNLLNVLDQVTILGILALGMTFVIVTGGIDLSVGSVLALSAAVFGLVLTSPIGSLPLAGGAAVLTGAAAGLVNGAVSVRWQLPTFLVTLGMLEMARGATYLLTDSRTMYLGARVDLISRDVLFGLGAPAVLAVLVIVAGQFMLTRMVLPSIVMT
jgi:ribose transport system permease protein